MKNNLKYPFDPVVKILGIAFIINTITATAHLTYDMDYENSKILTYLLDMIGTSLLLFVPTCLVILLLASMRETLGNYRTFWFIFIMGIAGPLIMFFLFENIFEQYTQHPSTLVTISIFGMLTAITFYYTAISGDTDQKEETV